MDGKGWTGDDGDGIGAAFCSKNKVTSWEARCFGFSEDHQLFFKGPDEEQPSNMDLELGF